MEGKRPEVDQKRNVVSNDIGKYINFIRGRLLLLVLTSLASNASTSFPKMHERVRLGPRRHHLQRQLAQYTQCARQFHRSPL